MTIYDPHEVEVLRRAAREGEGYAKALAVGDVFVGVQPEARKRFPDDRLAQSVFMHQALEHLPRLLLDGESNVIVRKAERP